MPFVKLILTWHRFVAKCFEAKRFVSIVSPERPLQKAPLITKGNSIK